MKSSLLAYLNSVFFQDIWNAIRAEQRVNTTMLRHNNRFITGCLQVDHLNINLPPGQFNVYIIPHIVDTRSVMATDVWVRSDTLVTEKNILWHVYYTTGIMLPKSHVYIYVPRHRTRIIIAISRLAILKTSASYQDAEHLCMTFYRNPDIQTRLDITSATLDNRTQTKTKGFLKRTYRNALDTAPYGTDLWINGHRRPFESLADCGDNDIVEIISDPNVEGCFTVYPQQDRTKFFSHKDSIFKDIVHIPKQINPDNNIITHNSCTLYVEDSDTGEGRYLHRIDPTSVTQITHNDIAVSSTVLSSLKQALGATSVRLHIQVRTYKHTNPLKPNNIFLSYLYDESDNDILAHLQGSKAPSLSFWQASVIEQNAYVRMMFDIPSSKDTDMAAFYRDAIGYINLAKLLCSHKSTHHNTDTVSVNKPYFLKNETLRPLIFKDGRRVPDKFIAYTTTATQVHIDLSYFYVGPSDEISVHLFREDERPLEMVTPTEDTPSKTLPIKNTRNRFHIYRRIPLDDPIASRTITSPYAYEWIDIDARPGTFQVEVDDHEVTITWASSQYGETFILIPTTYTQHTRIDISSMIHNQEPLIVPVTLGSDVTMPLPDAYSIDVYLNGYTLIPDLDYTSIPIRQDGHVVLTELMIATVDKLNDPNEMNILDIQVHPNITIHPQRGFIQGQVAVLDTATQGLPIWVDGLSCGIVDNKTYIKGERERSTISFIHADDIVTGHPYHLQISIPQQDMRVCWSDIDFRENIARWKEVAAYLDRRCLDTHKSDPSADRLIIEKPHKLYSPYVMSILKDILSGRLILRDDPNDATFLDQFMGYMHLRERDPIYQMHNAYKDDRFVDIYTTYADAVFIDADIYPDIDRLLTLLLQETRLLTKESD